MSIRDVLVHLADDGHFGDRLDTAVAVAERFDAHLIGLYVPAAPYLPGYLRDGNYAEKGQHPQRYGQGRPKPRRHEKGPKAVLQNSRAGSTALDFSDSLVGFSFCFRHGSSISRHFRDNLCRRTDQSDQG